MAFAGLNVRLSDVRGCGLALEFCADPNLVRTGDRIWMEASNDRETVCIGGHSKSDGTIGELSASTGWRRCECDHGAGDRTPVPIDSHDERFWWDLLYDIPCAVASHDDDS